MSQFKTDEQIQFCDLFSQLSGVGFKAADVARELKMTPAAVSMILSGARSPRDLTLDAMRRLVAEKTCTGGYVLHDAPPKKEIARLTKIADNIAEQLGELRRAIEEIKK